MRIILLILITTVSFAQPLVRGGDGATWSHQKEYVLTDGLTFKYVTDRDTARYFNPGDKKFEVTVTVKDITAPIEMKIEAETARVVERAQLDQGTGGNTICCVTGTTLTNTKLIFDGEKDTGNRKQIVFNYARGNTGKGKIVVSFTKNGVINSHTFYLDPTGTNVWNVWKESTFDLPPNQVGIMSISTDQPGAWNLDYVVIK